MAPNTLNDLRRVHGLTLLEVQLAGIILIAVLLGISGTLLGSVALTSTSSERDLALQTAREVVEKLRTEEFRGVFARHNASPADDPGGPGTAPGSRFDVPGLKPLPQDAKQPPGEILFPVKTKTDFVLTEEPVGPFAGERWDLDLDGEFGAAAISAESARVIPVAVRVRWLGESGWHSIELRTVLADRR